MSPANVAAQRAATTTDRERIMKLTPAERCCGVVLALVGGLFTLYWTWCYATKGVEITRVTRPFSRYICSPPFHINGHECLRIILTSGQTLRHEIVITGLWAATMLTLSLWGKRTYVVVGCIAPLALSTAATASVLGASLGLLLVLAPIKRISTRSSPS